MGGLLGLGTSTAVLALKAIIAYDKYRASAAPEGALVLRVDGAEVARARVGRGEAMPHAPIALGGDAIARDALGAPGRHVARLELTLDAAAEGSAAAAVALPFAIDAAWAAPRPATSGACARTARVPVGLHTSSARAL